MCTVKANCTDNTNNAMPYTDTLLEICSSILFEKNEKSLFKSLLSVSSSQTEIENILNDFDIDSVSDNKILIISNFIENHPELNLQHLLTEKVRQTKDLYMQNKLRLFVHLEKVAGEFKHFICPPPSVAQGGRHEYFKS